MSFVCGPDATPEPVVRILVGLRECCLDALEDGPAHCTCWEPEYDREQEPLNRALTPGTRAAMCEDCAYRPTSPEQQGDDRYQDNLGNEREPFWCHQGIRKPVRWRHPLGITVDADADGYTPPILAGVPFKADGTPADRCAGWAAHHREVTTSG